MTGNTQPKRNFLLLSGVLLLLILITPRPAYAQVGDYLLKVLFNFVVSVFGTIAGWAGLLLDFAIRELVIGFGNLYITSGLGNTVDAMWVIVRDIFNLTFIFGLVLIGLKMIFGSDNSGQKMLVSLIMAALLVNFSLFITKFVVDFSNIATVQLVNTFPKDKSGNLSISGSFVNAIGLTSLYKVDTTGNVTTNFFSNGSSAGGFTYIFSTMIILLIAAFVFAAGAFLLFIRFALLIFYLILSPLMFLGWVFPGGGGITSQFWSGFLGRAFFAPVYILMLYLSYRIILGFKAYPIFQTANFGKLAGSTSSSDVFAVLPPFILTAIFLIASVVIAQKMGISGAGGVISMGKTIAGKTKKMAFAGGANLALKGLDRAARDNGSSTNRPVLKQFRQATRSLARGATIVGARSGLESAAKPWTAMNKATKEAKAGLAARDSAARSEYAIEVGTDPTKVTKLASLRTLSKAGPLSPADATLLAQLETEERAMQSAVIGLGTKALENMSKNTLAAIAPHLTSSQVEGAMKSDNISDTDKNAIIAARQGAINSVVGATGSIITKELTKLSIDQIEMMGDQWIRDNAHLFSNSQMDEIKKSKKFTESQRNSFVAERNGWHAAAAAGTNYNGKTTNIADLFEHTAGGGDRKPEDIANLDKTILLNPDPAVHWFITAEALEAIAEKKTLNSGEKAILKANLLATPGPHHAKISAYFSSSHGLRYW